jgi:hypothetical protein
MLEDLNYTVDEEIKLDNEKDKDEPDDLAEKRKIYTEQGDPEVDSLHKRFRKGRLNVQPAFQRQFVWDRVKSSRLIESALLDIPIPIVYLSEDKEGKYNVIDGQQRLTAFFSFIDGRLPDDSEFKLSGLNVFTELNGKKFNQLSEDLQDKIITYKIRVISFKKESDSDLQFEIFTRLNTGSVPLNDQELRNCVFRGKFNDILKELSQDNDFKYLLGIATPDRRMKDTELVLRFAAFYFITYLNYNAPIKKFLNDTMEKYQNISSVDELNLRKAFKNSVSIIYSLLDKNAFKRFYIGDGKNRNGKWETQKFNVSLFDILMYSFALEDKNIVFQNLERIRESLIDLMTNDQEFINSIELSTSSKKAVTIRFDKWRSALKKILGIAEKEPRCFTFSLKQELFQDNDTCAICGNRIRNIDDAAVDHIKQYWTGGETIPENARLTHRFCNNARSRNENIENDQEEPPEGGPIETVIKDPKGPQRSGNKKFNFFDQLLTICNQKTSLFQKIAPQGYQSWLNAGAGKSGLAWTIICLKNSARVELFLCSVSSETNKAEFNYLLSQKTKIEASFGDELIWDFKDSRKQQYIKSICTIGGLNDVDRWSEIQNDLVDKLIRFEKAIRQYISEKDFHTLDEGIIDTKNNPFARKPWVEDGWTLTPGRQKQLSGLIGMSVEDIFMIESENDGRYVAFVGIRWGFASINSGKLMPTEKLSEHYLYDGYGRPLKKG